MNLKLKHRSLVSLFLPVMVLLFSAEILWRRMVTGQVPTQFSAVFVYSLLALNAVYFGRELRNFFRRSESMEGKKA